MAINLLQYYFPQTQVNQFQDDIIIQGTRRKKPPFAGKRSRFAPKVLRFRVNLFQDKTTDSTAQ